MKLPHYLKPALSVCVVLGFSLALGSAGYAQQGNPPPPEDISPYETAVDTPPPDDTPDTITNTVIVTPSTLFDGPAISPTGNPWISLGPGPTTNGQVEGLVNGEVVGAVHVILPHPTNANIAYAGAVNGGVWKTLNATAVDPTWLPMTDTFPSLSISALTFDSADATHNTVVAAIGTNSSFASFGGARTGLLRSTDGGTTWTALNGGGTLTGADITGVVVRGATIVLSVDFADAFTFGNIGVFRSTDTGATFTQVSTGDGSTTGLPGGSAFDIFSHPGDPTVIYTNIKFATIVGGVNGIYKSTDTGATWVKVSDVTMDALITNATSNIEFAIHNSVSANVVYAAILNSGQLIGGGVFRSTDGGTTWAQMDTPVTNETDNSGGSGVVGTNPRFKPDAGGPEPNTGEPGGQGSIHFAIAADPTDPDIVYVGGDRQPRGLNDSGSFPNSVGANNFTGRLFRGDASVTGNGGSSAPSPQWKHLTHTQDAGGMIGGGTASGSAPHADSREMAFDANGDLLEADDGGIYRRTNPQSNTGDWFSINGDLRVTEFHDIAYDTLSNIVLGGAQDTGTPEQGSSGDSTWFSVSTADGGDVATDVGDASNTSVRYSSFQNIGGFRRRTFDQSNVLLLTEFPARTVVSGAAFDPAFVTPVQSNAAAPGRLIIVGDNGVYESLDRGDTISNIIASSALAFRQNAVAYGGFSGAVAAPEALYVGLGGTVFVRTSAGALAQSVTYPGTLARDVVMNSTDWQTAWVADDSGIFQTTDAGGSWTNITGNYPDSLRSTINYAPCDMSFCVYVGGANGVYQTSATAPGTWLETGTGLPEAPVADLVYDAEDNLLIIGTFGRGAWSYSPGPMTGDCNGLTVTVDIGAGTGTPTSGDDVILGTAGIDVINAFGGNDTICGLGGADIINAGNGEDWVDAGDGDDVVQAGGDNDMVFGGAGDDDLFGGPGNDTIYGEADNDTVFGNSGNDTIDGGDGVDEIKGGSGNDDIETGSGATVGSGVIVDGGSGNDTITGGPDADLIRGSTDDDTIMGAGGDDQLFGGGGVDFVNGQSGNDFIRGNAANDELRGGSGMDNVDGGTGNDMVFGGADDDTLRGSTGNDMVRGESGNDSIVGGGGNDDLFGDSGSDNILGGGGNDNLDGGGGAPDTCDGQSGIDTASASCEIVLNIP